jgi:adenosine deaminase CECR1
LTFSRFALFYDLPSLSFIHSHVQVIAASEVTGLLTLGHIARDSIKARISLSFLRCQGITEVRLQFSMLTAEEKALATLKWEERWNQFVDEIVRFDGVQRN